ncbi:hypothetical protein [Streptomyces sp. NBC_01803]|uniref:hypothetical protein n=1 Tax=Streptomyces sp. NBC_01803 TaxID=2975946 RepID=UPI002DD83DC7|nr:hypothetical protein [Streptomyces sp. NBC_01803]WSA45524.1 hypothetical protein OIE51_15755 [Streptomyces sp. NBC_01803]
MATRLGCLLATTLTTLALIGINSPASAQPGDDDSFCTIDRKVNNSVDGASAYCYAAPWDADRFRLVIRCEVLADGLVEG